MVCLDVRGRPHAKGISRRANQRTCGVMDRVGVPGCEGPSAGERHFQAGQPAHLRGHEAALIHVLGLLPKGVHVGLWIAMEVWVARQRLGRDKMGRVDMRQGVR